MVWLRLLLTITLLISTCNLPTTGATPTATPTKPSRAENRLADTRWTLKSFGAVGAETPVIEGATITLKFGADRRAGGSGGCNSYGAEYQMQEGKLSFSKIISTKRACVAEGLMQQEQRYFRALESAGKFELADDRLTIFYDDGQSSLNFVKTSPSTSAE